MGQQQLLLLVLGMVIVGIAVVAGIQAFSEGRQKAATDAAVSDALRIATDIQAWVLKPKAFGGGGGNAKDLDFQKLGYPKKEGVYGYDPSTPTQYITPNGCFILSGNALDSENSLSQSNSVIITAKETCESTTKYAEVTITGTNVDNIATVVNTSGSG